MLRNKTPGSHCPRLGSFLKAFVVDGSGIAARPGGRCQGDTNWFCLHPLSWPPPIREAGAVSALEPSISSLGFLFILELMVSDGG